MASVFALLYVVFFVVTIVFLVMAIRNKKKNKPNSKEKIISIVSFVAFVVFFILTGVFNPGSSDLEKSENSDEERIVDDTSTEGISTEENAEQMVDSNNAEIVVEDAAELDDSKMGEYDAIDKCYEELISNNTTKNWSDFSSQVRDLTKKFGLYQDSKNNGLGTRYMKIASSSDEAKVISNDDLDKGIYYIRIVADFSKGSPDIQLIDNTNSSEEKVESSVQVNQYSEDDKVNQFIAEFNAISRYEMTDFEKGNIKQKLFGHVNDCYVEMLNPASTSGYSFIVTINGGNNEEITEKMNEVFPDFIHTLDSTVSEQDIEQAISDFKNDPSMRKDYKLGDDLIIYYHPLVFRDDGSWLSSSRIEISSLKYGE